MNSPTTDLREAVCVSGLCEFESSGPSSASWTTSDWWSGLFWLLKDGSLKSCTELRLDLRLWLLSPPIRTSFDGLVNDPKANPGSRFPFWFSFGPFVSGSLMLPGGWIVWWSSISSSVMYPPPLSITGVLDGWAGTWSWLFGSDWLEDLDWPVKVFSWVGGAWRSVVEPKCATGAE